MEGLLYEDVKAAGCRPCYSVVNEGSYEGYLILLLPHGPHQLDVKLEVVFGTDAVELP